MEIRLRRCNLRCVGLPERAEGSDPPMFFENLLINTYSKEAFSTKFIVERAHCLAARPLPSCAPPSTFIDRDTVLGLTHVRGNITFGNVNVAVFPDFSAEGQKKRAQFTEAKRQLRIHHLTYALLFPARLRVVMERPNSLKIPLQSCHGWNTAMQLALHLPRSPINLSLFLCL